MIIDPAVEARGRRYGELEGIQINFESPLGSGTDGAVWMSDRNTAVKALYRQKNYSHELECYQRFARAGVTNLAGFNVPKLVGHSDELMIVELGIVKPPFILDFAKVCLDNPPDFDPEVLEEADRENEERFGEQYWSRVRVLLWVLRSRYGIYYQDPKPGNIMFKDWPETD
jgi:hypothetical protein